MMLNLIVAEKIIVVLLIVMVILLIDNVVHRIKITQLKNQNIELYKLLRARYDILRRSLNE